MVEGTTPESVAEAEKQLRRHAVAVVRRRWPCPWRQQNASEVTYVQEVFLVLPAHVDPDTFRGTERHGVVFMGSRRPCRVGDRVCVRLCSPDVVAMGVARFHGAPAAADLPLYTERDRIDAGRVRGPVLRTQLAKGAAAPAFDGKTTWMGVQCDQAVGQHNGTIGDASYFNAGERRGVFVLPHQVTRAADDGTLWEGLPTVVHRPQSTEKNGVAVKYGGGVSHPPARAWLVGKKGGGLAVYRYAVELYAGGGRRARHKEFMAFVAERVRARDGAARPAAFGELIATAHAKYADEDAASSADPPRPVVVRGRRRGDSGVSSSSGPAPPASLPVKYPAGSAPAGAAAELTRRIDALDRQHAAFDGVMQGVLRQRQEAEDRARRSARAADAEASVELSDSGSDGDLEVELEAGSGGAFGMADACS